MKNEEEIKYSVRIIAIVDTSSISITGAFVFNIVHRFCVCAVQGKLDLKFKEIVKPTFVGRMCI